MSVTLKPYPEYKDSGLPWLGQIPVSWTMRRLDRLFTLRSELPNDDDERVTGYLDGRVTLRSNIKGQKIKGVIKEAGWQRVYPGDFAISGMNAHLGGMGVSDALGKCSPIYLVLRPRNGTNAHFVSRAVRHMAHMGVLKTLVNTIRFNSADFKREDLKSIYVWLPTAKEQDTIVSFLAHADRRINSLIRAKRRLIELLNEQKQAIIHRAVTRGLDPNVRLKNSGIDWLGDVPEHWEITALRIRYSVQLGKMLDTKRITGSYLVPYLRNTDVQWDRINSTNLPMMDIPEHEHKRYLVQPGDLLVCEGGDVGRSAFWDGAFPICGYQKALHRLRPISDRHECPRFLFYVMFAASKGGIFIADGSENTIAHLTAEKLRHYRFAFPPKAEQEAIARHLDRTLSKLEQAMQRANREIDLLREYRTRLIADVVTGKLDARGVELPMLDKTEAVEDWEADEDAETDEMEEMEGVEA